MNPKGCINCEFYCTTPPHVGWCNVKLAPVTFQSHYCDNFTRKIERHEMILESDISTIKFFPYLSYSDFIMSNLADDTVSILVNETKRECTPEQKCFSCGASLKIEIRGRRKYCASCGCYLPVIIYGDHFRGVIKRFSVGG